MESPTKAKTISRFLDSSYKISACMGHIRDLPESAKDVPEKYKNKSWKNLGINVEEDFKPIYCIPKSKAKVVQSLKEELKKAGELILATDEDREGESISWHLLQILKPKASVKRIVFHEITKEAIQSALKNYRSIDQKLGSGPGGAKGPGSAGGLQSLPPFMEKNNLGAFRRARAVSGRQADQRKGNRKDEFCCCPLLYPHS